MARPMPPPKPPKRKRRRPGTARGRVWMSADFDAPLPDFAKYER